MGAFVRRARAAAHEQRGMTLVETLVAVMLSGLMVMPMVGWATVAMREQAAIEQRNVGAVSLGLLRTYFVGDVSTATTATTTTDEMAACGTGAKGERELLELQTRSGTVTYGLIPGDGASTSLWRLRCAPESTKVIDRVELLGDVLEGVTDASCDSATVLTETDAAVGVTTRGNGRGSTKKAEPTKADPTKADPTKDKDGDVTDNDNGKGNSAGTTRPDAEAVAACRRVTLRVTTGDLQQSALTAVLRAGSVTDVEDAQPPVAVASGSPTSGPRRLTVRFVGSGSSDPAGSALSYRWDFGDGSSSTEADPTKGYTAVGSFTATLTVTNDAGLSSSATVPVTVADNAPVAVIAAPTTGTTVFRGQQVAFSSAGSNDDRDKDFGGRITAYAWDFGDGTTSTEANPTKQYGALSPAGGYTVRLTVTDDAGGTASAETKVVVANRTPTATIVASTTSGTAPLTVDFSSVVVDETTMSPNPTLTYAWNFGDGGTSTLADPPARTYSTAGTRTVTLTVTDDQGATASASTTVTVDAPLLAAPGGLKKKSSGTTSGKRWIDLQFNAVSGAAAYEVRVTCVSKNCTDVFSNTGTTTTIRISGLQNKSLSYDAQVRTLNSTGQWGPWSSIRRVSA
jgi:PKD repeat protein/type II secretory pathway pseudopilin PulG